MHTYIHSLSHTSSFTYNLVPPNCFYFSILHHLLCLSFLLRPATTFVAHYCIGRSWHVGLSGPLIFGVAYSRYTATVHVYVSHTHTSLGWLIAFSCTCTCTSCYASALLLHLHTLLRFWLMRKVELLVALCLSAFRSGYVNHGRTSRKLHLNT